MALVFRLNKIILVQTLNFLDRADDFVFFLKTRMNHIISSLSVLFQIIHLSIEISKDINHYCNIFHLHYIAQTHPVRSEDSSCSSVLIARLQQQVGLLLSGS